MNALRRWIRAWLRRREQALDEKYLLPALEQAADARGLTGLERKAAIAKAWELHQSMEGSGHGPS